MKKKSYIFLVCTLFLSLFITLTLGEIFCVLLHKHNLSRSDENQITFYIIGGSTAYGEPYHEKTHFAKIVSDSLGGEYDGKTIHTEMIASRGADLNLNIFRFVKHLVRSPSKHGIVLVYSGINEWISGKEKIVPSKINRFLSHFFVGHFILHLISPDPDKNHNNSYHLYKHRLENLLYWSGKMGYKNFVSSLAGNFHDYPVGAHKSVANKELKAIVECEQKKDHHRYLCLQQLQVNHPQYQFEFDWVRYQNAPTLANLTRLDQHYRTFEIFHDSTNYRPQPRKNEVILATVNSTENTDYVPFYENLKNKNRGYIGDSFFVDAHHPNLVGMRVLAQSFLNKMLSSPPQIKTVDELKLTYKIDHQFQKVVCDNQFIWYFYAALKQEYPFVLKRKLIKTLQSTGCAVNNYASFAHELFFPLTPAGNIKPTILAKPHFKDIKNKLFEFSKIKTRYKKHLNQALKNNFLTQTEYSSYIHNLDL